MHINKNLIIVHKITGEITIRHYSSTGSLGRITKSIYEGLIHNMLLAYYSTNPTVLKTAIQHIGGRYYVRNKK